MSATGHNLRRRLRAKREAAQAGAAAFDDATASIKATAEKVASAPQSPASESEPAHTSSVFDLSGNWMRKRAEVRDALGTDHVPKTKDEAADWLREAGYEVEGV